MRLYPGASLDEVLARRRICPGCCRCCDAFADAVAAKIRDTFELGLRYGPRSSAASDDLERAGTPHSGGLRRALPAALPDWPRQARHPV